MVEVEFSDIAEAGLRRSMSEDERRKGFKLSIKFHLSVENPEYKSDFVMQFRGVFVYALELYGHRICWNRRPDNSIFVWSVAPLNRST